MAAAKYDEFMESLREHKRQFTEVEGREPVTMKEFEEFVERRKTRGRGTGALRSLKGLSF